MAVAITAAVVALAAGGALGLGGGEQQEVRPVLAPGLAGGGLADEVGPAQCRQERDDPPVLGFRLVETDRLAPPTAEERRGGKAWVMPGRSRWWPSC